MKRCLELRDSRHDKFWTIQVIGNHYFVTFGRIGSRGQTQVKQVGGGQYAARAAASKLITSKLAKGYRQVADDKHPCAPVSMTAALETPRSASPSARPNAVPTTQQRRELNLRKTEET